MRARTALGVGLALLVGLPPVSAAPKPQITDPTGDYQVAVGDIVSVTFSTLPKGTKEVLQVDMVLAGAPATTTPFAYTVSFLLDDCDYRAIYFGHPLTTPPGDQVFLTSRAGCADSDTTNVPVKVSGTHVIWTLALKGKLKRGALIETLKAATSPSGMQSGSLGGDTAVGIDEWVVGSDRPLKKKR